MFKLRSNFIYSDHLITCDKFYKRAKFSFGIWHIVNILANNRSVVCGGNLKDRVNIQ